MAALASNVRQQLERKSTVIKFYVEVLRNWTRHYCGYKDGKPAFGLLFDIDGVIVRGKKVLPSALESFKRLVDSEGRFRIPTVFVTNAGNALRHEKAEQLSCWLEIEVNEEQVVMAHSPLRMFQQYHNKHVLISGQGPIVEIAKNLGFKKIVTIDQMRNAFPLLDAVDHKRRISVPCTFEQYFPRIEAIVLFGEPVRWETSLQLLIDTLMTDGMLAHPVSHLVYPHIPLLACNMDLQWMAEAWMPRFGHGAFLLCLENLYKKVTGHNLIYTALVGKPSEITYHHAHHMVVAQAKNIGIDHCVKRLYAIGDNIYTDVFGANLYDCYLSRRNIQGSKRIVNKERNIEELLGSDSSEWDHVAESCSSILVQTGVYSEGVQSGMLDHSPRDFLPVEEKLRAPKFTVENVSNAIDLIFHKEGFH
ncbi:haloacid dehalogenase-like hydrolase domain-containing 5 isoform X1 [Zootermopsis nevadensis]|uniref:Haloacid dehalogenase-like hydrolase domain-containing 5 n=1 Tax=Zootermopsis nevadensis TaxID=136037 RepID=A0A067QUW7_ZOONE|nr:haloacid dehalogenase-like hydrolase domain-containing 5 isoform X1 [Zootermopsis nevadensis]KDR13978.1 Cat eye syndrome critical region protein 5 [Zootermopsis nevadensis]